MIPARVSLPDNFAPEALPISALYAQLLTGWNAQRAADFAALFVDDGFVVGFDGSLMDGRAAIEAELSRLFTDHPTGLYVGLVRAVHFLGADAAVLRAVAGLVPRGGTALNPATNSIQALVAERQAGQWRIAHYHNTPAQFHGRPELAETLTRELQQLVS